MMIHNRILDNDKLEFIWTIIPVIALAGLIMYGLFTWNDIMFIDEEEDPLVIELYAQQEKISNDNKPIDFINLDPS